LLSITNKKSNKCSTIISLPNAAGGLEDFELGESSNATSAADSNKVLAAFNATLTRCNGIYEKDLEIHLNLIPKTTSIIYFNASTDTYTTMSSWNA
jgi:hypothetical protein